MKSFTLVRECTYVVLLSAPGPTPPSNAGVRLCGQHRFQFVDGYSLHVHVFASEGCEGVPGETDEAVPLWVPVDAIPYDEMWADDRLWVPLMLEGVPFSGRWIFDGDAIVDHVLETG